MKEQPIPFTGDMVRAILDDRKTMTRRVIKPQPTWIENSGRWWWQKNDAISASREWREYMDTLKLCPYGAVGDRLWVQETFSTWFEPCDHWYDIEPEERQETYCLNRFYRATHPYPDDDQTWVPPRFMPRWVSRITLEITGIRVERVQEIKDEQAIFEGCPLVIATVAHKEACREWFRFFWNSLNAKRGYGWDKNPWVWVIEFKRIK